ncbi:MAG: hypothetical protein V2A61_08120 [Calditrichota bacterium]
MNTPTPKSPPSQKPNDHGLPPPRKRGFVEGVSWFFIRLVTGVMLLGAFGWWGYIQIMKQALGRFDIFDWKKAAISLIGESQVILVNASRTDAYFKANLKVQDSTQTWPYYPRNDPWPLADTLWYSAIMQDPYKVRKAEEDRAWQDIGIWTQKEQQPSVYWKDLLFELKTDYKEIEEPGLEKLVGGNVVVIMPGAILLSEGEKRGIKNFLAQGGKLLATWSAGSRDENGNWKGFDFLSQITGAVPAESITDPGGGASMVLRGGGPVNAMIPPGTHLDIYTYNGYISMKLVESRAVSDAYWFKPYWQSIAPNDLSNQATVIHGQYLQGRYVWLSFVPETVQQWESNDQIIRQMIINALSWLQEKPVVNADVWPEGYTAGGALILEAKGLGSNVQLLAAEAAQAGFQFDFMFDSDYLPTSINFSGILKQDVIISMARGRDLAELSYGEQKKWFKYQTEKLQRLTGRSVNGFHTHDWIYDNDMLIAAAKSKCSYVLAENQPYSYGSQYKTLKPTRWKIFFRNLWISTYPKSCLTMREWYENKGMKNPESLFNSMMADFKRIRNTRGLYLAFIDPTVMTNEAMRNIPIRMAAAMDSLNVWRAPTSQLMDRYSGWQGLRVSSKLVTSSRVRIIISHQARIVLRNVPFQVYVSPIYASVAVSSEVVGFTPVQVSWDRDQGICRFVIPELDPGDNTSIFLDFTLPTLP